jgi:hypothetical protein
MYSDLKSCIEREVIERPTLNYETLIGDFVLTLLAADFAPVTALASWDVRKRR